MKWIGSFFLAAILTAPAWGATPALPGTVNYVEGQAAIGDQSLSASSVGSANLQAGQTLTTQAGKAEILLTPGVFFRVGDNSVATMVSPTLTNTEVGLSKGQAIVEVAEIHNDNLLRVQEDGATTQLLKPGVYGFDADSGDVRVFKGEAVVQDGDQQVKVKGGHELNVNNTAKLKSSKFDQAAYAQSDLYRFSSLRSQYLAEANVAAAGAYVGGLGWYGGGWYWNPLFTAYTWIPGDGVFYSPFGWGFYSPLWVGYAPYYGRYYPHGYVAGRYGAAYAHPGYVGRPASGFRGPASAGAAAPHFAGGGGFHGGGGGFHR